LAYKKNWYFCGSDENGTDKKMAPRHHISNVSMVLTIDLLWCHKLFDTDVPKTVSALVVQPASYMLSSRSKRKAYM